MADAVDIATEIIETDLQQRLTQRQQFFGDSLLNCESCDDEIPLLRRQTLPGVTTCVYCQQLLEDRSYAHHRRRYTTSQS